MSDTKPAIVAVDDEPAVLSAVSRDLRREYGERFRIVRADSGTAALESLKQLKLRGESVALLLADQRMPGISGVEFLRQATELYPEARRVLLTAYADTDVAIRAINEVKLNHYLMKPWDPPEENLYPVLSDQLEDWEANVVPPSGGVRIVGHRWSAESHRVKDFLARNQVPYRWLEVDDQGEATDLLELSGGGTSVLPVVFFEDGTWEVRPDNTHLAERLGLKTKAAAPFYDLIIVGGGPAGLASAVYGASEGLKTLLVEAEAPGGQAGTSSAIENYLGFPAGLSGGDLARRAVAQAKRFGAEILTPLEACGLRLQDSYRFVKLTNGEEISCHAVIIASGVQYRTLDVPDLDRLTGAGVYYGAAITEALTHREQDVFIIGGGNSAGQAAMYLSRYGRTVTILVRGPSLAASMSSYLIQRIDEAPNVEVSPESKVLGVRGDDRLEALMLERKGEKVCVPAGALFIFIGAVPRTDWVAGMVERDDFGFIYSGNEVIHDGHRPRGWNVARDPFWLETSVPGVFVAGDVRHRSVKRVASAVGEGSMAVQFIHQHLAGLGS